MRVAKLHSSLALISSSALGVLIACAPRQHPGPPAAGVAITAPASVALACEGRRRSHCTATVALSVTSSRDDAVTVERVRRNSVTGAITVVGLPVHVPPHAGITVRVFAHRARLLHLPIRVRDTRGAVIAELEPPPVAITNPLREAAEEACHACNGEWGLHGRAAREPERPGLDDGAFCICRAHDAGKECRDGDDCEGACLPTRTEIVGTTGSTQQVRLVGACSELVERTTCTTPIAHGASREPPLTVPAGRTVDPGSSCPEDDAVVEGNPAIAGDDGLD